MKIWLMNHYASNMFRDRAGRHYWFAEKLIKSGNDVSVFCSTTLVDGQEYLSIGNEKYLVKDANGIPFVFVKTKPSRGNGLSRVKNMFFFYKNLFPAAKDYAKQTGRPDVIVASSVHPLTMVAGIKLAKKWKIPCICEIRDLWPEAIFAFGKAKPNSLLGKALIAGEHWIYKRADALIFTKEGDTDYLKEKGWTTEQGGKIDLKKCHYINNGIDLAAFSESIVSQIPVDDDLKEEGVFRVTYTGTIRPVNNVGNLLDCAKLFLGLPGYEDVKFLIYGDGSDLPKLRERLETEAISNVSLKGRAERKYIPYILSRSSVNVLNYSQKEYNWTRGNSSNKLFEYMASGKPVISTVRMGYSIIDRYHCGSELKECTPECLADEIKRYHDMPVEDRNMIGFNAAEGAKDFDFNILTSKLVKVIESVTKK